MDRKPEDGCKIQNSANGRSGIMMQLKLVKSARHEASVHAGGNNSTIDTVEDEGAVTDDNGQVLLCLVLLCYSVIYYLTPYLLLLAVC
jgi:hypothetical protein